jgi:hypothetical protein
MLTIQRVEAAPLAGIPISQAELRGVTVDDFLRRALARGFAVAQHKSTFFLVRIH